VSKQQEINLIKLIERSDCEERCRAYLEGLRWPDGVTCPRCGSDKISRIRTRDQLDCDSCRYRFSVTAGTIFHGSHLPLWKWFIAVYLIVGPQKGISINQLKRNIGVSYKTAWYLRHRIRAALIKVNIHLMSGMVEVNEIFLGGEMEEEGQRCRANKTIFEAADSTRAASSNRDGEYETVRDQGKERVGDDAHTDSIDNVCSLLKQSISGSYPQVHAKHLNAYLDELRCRFNNRENPYMLRDAMWKLLVADNLAC
jgi:transposase-like protein